MERSLFQDGVFVMLNVIVGILQLDILPISIRQHFLAIIPQHKEIYQCIAVFSAIH